MNEGNTEWSGIDNGRMTKKQKGEKNSDVNKDTNLEAKDRAKDLQGQGQDQEPIIQGEGQDKGLTLCTYVNVN